VGKHTSSSLLLQGPQITQADVIKALENFTPANLRSARLFASEISWEDVGGLSAVRGEIRDILEMPVRYARVYMQVEKREAEERGGRWWWW